MTETTASTVLSFVASHPEMNGPEYAASRYAYMLLRTPTVENGFILEEIARAGLVALFREAIIKQASNLPQTRGHMHLVHEASLFMANELADAILAIGDSRERMRLSLCIDDYVSYAGFRFAGHVSGTIKSVTARIRVRALENNDLYPEEFFEWFAKPLELATRPTKALAA